MSRLSRVIAGLQRQGLSAREARGEFFTRIKPAWIRLNVLRARGLSAEQAREVLRWQYQAETETVQVDGDQEEKGPVKVDASNLVCHGCGVSRDVWLSDVREEERG